MKEKEVFDLIMKSLPEDYTYSDQDGLYYNKSDINLRLQIMREEEESFYNADWTSRFADKKATLTLVRIHYLMTLIKTISYVWVDSGRHLIPKPHLGEENIYITRSEYKIGSILNYPFPFGGFDEALQRAGIEIRD